MERQLFEIDSKPNLPDQSTAAQDGNGTGEWHATTRGAAIVGCFTAAVIMGVGGVFYEIPEPAAVVFGGLAGSVIGATAERLLHGGD